MTKHSIYTRPREYTYFEPTEIKWYEGDIDSPRTAFRFFPEDAMQRLSKLETEEIAQIIRDNPQDTGAYLHALWSLGRDQAIFELSSIKKFGMDAVSTQQISIAKEFAGLAEQYIDLGGGVQELYIAAANIFALTYNSINGTVPYAELNKPDLDNIYDLVGIIAGGFENIPVKEVLAN